jgi:hypothetical protein
MLLQTSAGAECPRALFHLEAAIECGRICFCTWCDFLEGADDSVIVFE